MLLADWSALGTGHLYPRETSVVGITAREAQCPNQLHHRVTLFNDICIYGTLSFRQLHLQIGHVIWFLKRFMLHMLQYCLHVSHTQFSLLKIPKEGSPQLDHKCLLNVVFYVCIPHRSLYSIFADKNIIQIPVILLCWITYLELIFFISFIFICRNIAINMLSSIYVTKIYFKSVLDTL